MKGADLDYIEGEKKKLDMTDEPDPSNTKKRLYRGKGRPSSKRPGKKGGAGSL